MRRRALFLSAKWAKRDVLWRDLYWRPYSIARKVFTGHRTGFSNTGA